MVEYACKTSTALVLETAQRCARLCQSVCRGWLATGNRVNTWLVLRFCSMGFNSPVFAGSNPALCDHYAYASGLESPVKT